MNNRGLTNQMFVVFLMALVLIFIFVGYFIWSLIGPVLVVSSSQITGALQNVTKGNNNLTAVVNSTIVPLNQGFAQNLEWASYSVLIFLLLGFMLCCFFVRTYPVLSIFWIGFTFVIAFASIYLSSAYTDMLNGSDAIARSYQSWTANTFLITHLPTISILMGVFGGIILFVLLTRDPEAELVTA